MKLVILADGSKYTFEQMVLRLDAKESILIDTESCDEAHEFRYLFDAIHELSHSGKEVLLAKFSGKENVSKNLGDECSEMIVTLSDRRGSRFYTEHPVEVCSELINIFG